MRQIFIVWIGILAGLLFHSGGSVLDAQTCCSGGVPLSGNIGFEGSESGTLQLELSYDLNFLSTLLIGSESLEDPSRKRQTHSVILKTGYSINRWLAVDGLFSYVVQQRTIEFLDQTNHVSAHGPGDAVILPKVILSRISKSGTEIQLGAGPKIPVGRTDLTDERGITLNADLQPGSGSWDLISWFFVVRQLTFRPSMALSGRIVGRANGANDSYLGSQEYRFGNSLQVFVGLGDQILLGKQLFAPSVSLRYRHAWPDRINGQELDNTGGRWINLISALAFHPGPRTIIQVIPEIPLYSYVEGVQLTPTFRIQTGIYYRFGSPNKATSNQGQL